MAVLLLFLIMAITIMASTIMAVIPRFSLCNNGSYLDNHVHYVLDFDGCNHPDIQNDSLDYHSLRPVGIITLAIMMALTIMSSSS